MLLAASILVVPHQKISKVAHETQWIETKGTSSLNYIPKLLVGHLDSNRAHMTSFL